MEEQRTSGHSSIFLCVTFAKKAAFPGYFQGKKVRVSFVWPANISTFRPLKRNVAHSMMVTKMYTFLGKEMDQSRR